MTVTSKGTRTELMLIVVKALYAEGPFWELRSHCCLKHHFFIQFELHCIIIDSFLKHDYT